jgi:hypothetical protein
MGLPDLATLAPSVTLERVRRNMMDLAAQAGLKVTIWSELPAPGKLKLRDFGLFVDTPLGELPAEEGARLLGWVHVPEGEAT